ncbi:MAG: trypsin-like serine protease [Myxococcales bacterium]|nr:trypsin-like serine protease [Myxococcales bacterium]MCB9751814.1 trypsin-like serine protease [Myxococcales bacterium]
MAFRRATAGSIVFIGAAVLCGAPAPANADPGADAPLVDDVAPSGIYQGEETQGCAWPTTVAVTGGNSLCTGTLIHPRVVAYAAHCGAGNKTILFGNSSQVGSKTIQTEFCRTNPAYSGVSDQAHDWAFCKLTQSIEDLPITPIVMGCEGNQYLQAGAQVAIVGFGNNSVNDTGAGTKRWAMTTLHNVIGNVAHVGGAPDAGICSGDSGGPAFVQYDDGTWHAFGIASTVTGGCSGLGTHSLLPAAAAWIEEESGIDVTPCFTTNGQWDADFRCGGFAESGPQSFGEWPTWCEGTPASGASSTCGDPYDAEADTTAPIVTILNPIHGMVYDSGTKLPIEIDALDPGWGVKSAWISIEGMDQPGIEYPPFKYGAVQFPDGVWHLTAFAEDGAGNLGESAEVTIYVGVEPGETTGGDSSTGGDATTDDPSAGTSDSSAGDDDDDSAPGDDDDDDDDASGTETSMMDSEGDGEGCGCRADDDARGWALAGLGLLGLLGVRRRRR